LEIIVFDWLLDGFWVFAFLLGAACAAFSVAWWKTRKKQYAIGGGVFVLLLGLYIALYCLIETSSQQMEKRVREIAASVKNKQIRSALEKNLADDFHVATYNKSAFIDKAQSLRDHFGVDALDVRDFKLVEIDREKKTATVHFIAQPLVPGEQTPWYLVKAQFVMTSSGTWTEEWKMRSFEHFNAIADTNSPLPIP
jgi:hypothetical protein